MSNRMGHRAVAENAHFIVQRARAWHRFTAQASRDNLTQRASVYQDAPTPPPEFSEFYKIIKLLGKISYKMGHL